MACQVNHSVVIEKLKELIKEFPATLNHDAKDMVVASERAKKVACALSQSMPLRECNLSPQLEFQLVGHTS